MPRAKKIHETGAQRAKRLETNIIREKPAKKPTSLITFLLDRSGSMGAIKATTIEAFNAYLGGLKAEKDAQINFTFLQFDSNSLDKCCVNTAVGEVPELNEFTYQPRGETPLIAAAIQTINAVDGALAVRRDNPRVVVCIQTDGRENASGHNYTWDQLRALVAAKTEAGWEFNFMGAGIEVYDQSARMGISAVNTMSYNSADRGGTISAFAASAQNSAAFSAGRSMSTGYSTLQKTQAGDAWAAKYDQRMAKLDLTNATSK